MNNLNSFFISDIKFEYLEKVMIDLSEVIGRVISARINSDEGTVEYLVTFPYGSVWVPNNETEDRGACDVDIAWIAQNCLRKI